ncbi:nitrate/nitrite transporter NrtS [Alloalcanivorax sp.]|jgi:hypothetical protein|uniref:nitrate/nitrite transporter NrtS n=1 Tax=Alloalcanivorax TaxID=3020832 RepID=UPI000ABC4B36|nr:nitrate/nitrite transporter NrtS [Pseudomonadota bacterium]HAB08207.1 hypothetical protein [Alcanivorax sp.]MED5601694.1 nitrate/nitrite transporter NrtS [Pseudomonadota bacterium]HBL88041.1 hypothetical protein [Alcanivorax sp.]HBM24595.1 hypothetical protein [Alcanivorax sp.]|tara:strand:- start:15358 stop:15582 length:225 start_codon:yes stop_codon:yes gene_type:complete
MICLPCLIENLRSPGVLRRALRTSLLVGTLLVLINHGPTLWQGLLPPLWQLLLTYLVPWGVSAWSSIAAIRQNH